LRREGKVPVAVRVVEGDLRVAAVMAGMVLQEVQVHL
jgi:hypothetical protein